MRIRVEGRAPLNGTYQPSGNANAAQALLAAALLTDQPVTLSNVPDTLSTQGLLQLIESLGGRIERESDRLILYPEQVSRRVLTQAETDATLGMILLVAPMLIRCQHVRLEIDFPLNRIRTHLEALRDLGIDVINRDGAVEFKGVRWDKREIVLLQASVTATAMIMMLASRLGSRTIVHNAACEPHIQELAHALVSMGARIEGIGSSVLTIFGTDELSGAAWTVPPDYIEAASVAAICAMSGGRAQINGVGLREMRVIAKIFWSLGIQIDLDEQALYIPRHEVLTVSNREEDIDASIETAPWPGFPSDLVAIATVIATQARGTSLIHEKMYNNRLLFVDKLKAMGAQIVLCDPHRAIVVGQTPLRGIYMDSPDVRTGLGMLGAALIADGESVIDNAQALEYTFSGALAKLTALNAKITTE
jgi:UDP-N-acetylglucosamine 1-carboxyvinyltransferase